MIWDLLFNMLAGLALNAQNPRVSKIELGLLDGRDNSGCYLAAIRSPATRGTSATTASPFSAHDLY
jgi:hypothetical protein